VRINASMISDFGDWFTCGFVGFGFKGGLTCGFVWKLPMHVHPLGQRRCIYIVEGGGSRWPRELE
jgi:hypothetical protein